MNTLAHIIMEDDGGGGGGGGGGGVETNAPPPARNRNLLEMYCGCGAHTIPISKAMLFDSIVAVEMVSSLSVP